MVTVDKRHIGPSYLGHCLNPILYSADRFLFFFFFVFGSTHAGSEVQPPERGCWKACCDKNMLSEPETRLTEGRGRGRRKAREREGGRCEREHQNQGVFSTVSLSCLVPGQGEMNYRVQ